MMYVAVTSEATTRIQDAATAHKSELGLNRTLKISRQCIFPSM
jgi:hypothetical protein